MARTDGARPKIRGFKLVRTNARAPADALSSGHRLVGSSWPRDNSPALGAAINPSCRFPQPASRWPRNLKPRGRIMAEKMIRSGDDCPNCDGHLTVYSGHRNGALHVQYIRCWKCGRSPERNRIVVPADSIRKRKPHKSSVLFRSNSPPNAIEPSEQVARMISDDSEHATNSTEPQRDRDSAVRSR